MAQPQHPRGHRKTCFVTIGATASFDSLVRATLTPSFLSALQSSGYTDLRLQHGTDGVSILKDFLAANLNNNGVTHNLKITGFDFDKQGLTQEMRAAKGQNSAAEGIVISHAGSGSILAALRIAVPIIVVPNPELLDNHQVELAEALAGQGYVVHGRLDDLPAAIQQAELLREKQNAWPPDNKAADPSGRGLAGVMDDEMGFVD